MKLAWALVSLVSTERPSQTKRFCRRVHISRASQEGPYSLLVQIDIVQVDIVSPYLIQTMYIWNTWVLMRLDVFEKWKMIWSFWKHMFFLIYKEFILEGSMLVHTKKNIPFYLNLQVGFLSFLLWQRQVGNNIHNH